MNEQHRNAHSLLSALGHSSRFRLTLCLLGGERCVGELALAIGLSQSCTTRHVQALERAGIVRSRRDGKRVLVGLESGRDELARLLEWLAPGAAVPAPAVAAGPASPESAPARSARGAGAGHGGRPRRAPTGVRAPAPGPEAEPAPTRTPASGTHAPPEQEPPSHPRRPRETLEDFLL